MAGDGEPARARRTLVGSVDRFSVPNQRPPPTNPPTNPPPNPPTLPLPRHDGDEQVVVRNRISRFTYVDGSPAQTRASEVILLTTDAKDTEIHSAGWLGFKPSAYGQGVSGSESESD